MFGGTEPLIYCVCGLNDYVLGRALNAYVCALGYTPKYLMLRALNDYVFGRAQNDYVCLGGAQPII